jgi:hypothetical protein
MKDFSISVKELLEQYQRENRFVAVVCSHLTETMDNFLHEDQSHEYFELIELN